MSGTWNAWRMVARDGIRKLGGEDASVPRAWIIHRGCYGALAGF